MIIAQGLEGIKSFVIPRINFAWEVTKSSYYFSNEADMGFTFNDLLECTETSNSGSFISQLLYIQVSHMLKPWYLRGTASEPDFVGKYGSFEFKKASKAGKKWTLIYNKSYFSSSKRRIPAEYTVVVKLNKAEFDGCVVIKTPTKHDTSLIPAHVQMVNIPVDNTL